MSGCTAHARQTLVFRADGVNRQSWNSWRTKQPLDPTWTQSPQLAPWPAAFHRPLDSFGGLCVRRGELMGIDAQGGRWVCMAETAADGAYVKAGGDQGR